MYTNIVFGDSNSVLFIKVPIFQGVLLTLYQPMMHICVMSVLLFFHKSIRIYMEVIILGANTLYSVFCFFKALLPEQIWSGMVGKGLRGFHYIR